MNEIEHITEVTEQEVNVQFSLGFYVHAAGGDDGDHILDVIPGSPAGKAGIVPGMRLVAVNGRKWNADVLRDAIRQAKNSKEPIDLLAQNGDFFQTYHIDYHGGERYPHLEPITGKPDLLAEIARTKAAPVPAPAKQ